MVPNIKHRPVCCVKAFCRMDAAAGAAAMWLKARWQGRCRPMPMMMARLISGTVECFAPPGTLVYAP